jgi:hypothetical protein
MTTTIAYSLAGDGYLDSQSSSYSAMSNGTGTLTLQAGTQTGYYGRNNNAGQYRGFQTFLTFTYAVPATDFVTAAYVRFHTAAMVSTGTARDFRLASYAYGTLGTVDWRTPTELSALTILGEVDEINGSSGEFFHAGSGALVAAVISGSTVEAVAFSQAQLAGSAPTVDEGASFYLSETTGTADDPALVIASVARSRLWPVLGAHCKLSDGSWVYLESDGASSDPVITMKHCTTAGVVSTVTTIPTGAGGHEFSVGTTVGAQGLALVADTSNFGTDSLYVIGKAGNTANSLAAKGYVKGPGYTWSAQSTRTWPLVAYDARINGVAAAFHNFANGTIFAAFSHSVGVGKTGTDGNEIAYAMLDAAYLRTGSGSLMREHDSALTVGLQSGSYTGAIFNSFANEVGTGLDVAAGSSPNQAWGYLASFTKDARTGGMARLRPGRYIIAGSGTALSHASVEDAGYYLKDAGAKARAIRTSSSTVAYLSADPDPGWGLSVYVIQYSGTASGGVELAYDPLANNGITNMPDGPAIGPASWWDAVYNSVSNTLEIYFRDSVSPRILRRTTFSLTTMLALNNSTVVYTAPSGTAEIQAIRLQRGADAGTTGLICMAIKDGSTLSLVNVIDTFNLAPNAPTLTPKANFDATAASTFVWTFNDPNAGDVQTAYEFQVDRTDTGASVIATGKVASATSSRNVAGATLTNGLSYRWRVRTWDGADTVGPWSGYGTFSTSAGGTVTITNPAADNPAGVITDDYLISWSVAGTTQAAYRVWLKVHSTGATVSDTGWVTSTATIHNVTGMASGIENRIEVRVRNAALVESGTGTRLITPDYGSPEVPVITVTPDGAGGYIEVIVTNPAPSGDRPEVIRNDILRRPVGGSTYSVVGSCGPDGTFQDYSAASGVTYEYVARGVA